LQDQQHGYTSGKQIETSDRIWNIFFHIKTKAIRQLTDGLKISNISE
jgi:hypothetical protein